MVLPELVESEAEVAAGIDVNHIAPVERLLHCAAHFLVVEDVSDFTKLCHKDITADLREGFLQAVHELQHEA